MTARFNNFGNSVKMTTEDGSLDKQERIWAKVGIEKWGMGWRGGFHGTGSEEEEERQQFQWEGSDDRTIIKASTNNYSAAH